MSFYTSLSGLKGAQTYLSVISNNLANVGSTGFKRSWAQFGDLFAGSPTQSTKMQAGQGARLNAVVQQYTQGTLEATDKTLDLAVAGEGFFVTRGDPPREAVTYNCLAEQRRVCRSRRVLRRCLILFQRSPKYGTLQST